MVTLYKIMSQSQSAFHTNTNWSSVLTQSENDRMQKKKKEKMYGIGDGWPGYSESTISSDG